MQPIGLFGLSVALSFVAWGIVTAYAIWPELRERTFEDAMRPLLILHSFRFVGLSFLIPGVVSGDLPVNFTFDAAYGDIVAMLLAIAALQALHAAVLAPHTTLCRSIRLLKHKTYQFCLTAHAGLLEDVRQMRAH